MSRVVKETKEMLKMYEITTRESISWCKKNRLFHFPKGINKGKNLKAFIKIQKELK